MIRSSLPSILLFGGNSEERLVSVASAQNLDRCYQFSERWFLHPDGRVCKVASAELQAHARAFENPFRPQAPAFQNMLLTAISELRGKAVMIGMHGSEGEDGSLQAIFESEKIPFTGSGSESSRNCFDKLKAKRIVNQNGLRTSVHLSLTVSTRERLTAELTNYLDSHREIVLKPVESGSSFGLHIVKNLAELAPAINAILASTHPMYMAEKFVSGRELTVGVHDHQGKLEALPPSEVLIEAGHSFDYLGKYLGRGTREITPADLTAEQTAQAQELARAAHRALGCIGYSRTDMILTDTGPVFLETNTLPGMTSASFFPQQLAAQNLRTGDFIGAQLTLAENRYRG